MTLLFGLGWTIVFKFHESPIRELRDKGIRLLKNNIQLNLYRYVSRYRLLKDLRRFLKQKSNLKVE